MRARVLVLMLAGLVAAGCSGDDEEQAEPHPKSRVVVVTPDPEAAARVPIVGATPLEERATRQALAGLGPAPGIRRISFDDRGPEADPRRIVIEIASAGDAAVQFEREWLGYLVATDVQDALRRRGGWVDWIEVADTGMLLDPALFKHRTADEVGALGTGIAAQLASQGYRASVTAYPIGPGAVKVVVPLSPEQIIRNESVDWSSVLQGRSNRAAFYLAFNMTVGPDGIPLAYGANFGRSTGGGTSEAAAGDRVSGPPLALDGATRLSVEIDRSFSSGQTLRYAIDCPTDQRVCEAIRSDWLTFVPPTSRGAECGGPQTDTMRLEGTLGGIPIEREYDGCYADTIQRWERLLGVPLPSY
jgi:hypothetical protein